MADGQVLDLHARYCEGALATRRLDEGRLGRNVDCFCRAARFERQGRDRHAVPAAHRDTRSARCAKPVQGYFDDVGIRCDIWKHIVAGGARDDGHGFGAARFANENDCRAGNDEPLAVAHRSSDGTGRDLRRRPYREDANEQADRERSDCQPIIHLPLLQNRARLVVVHAFADRAESCDSGGRGTASWWW